jgi:hypothetical protein
MHGYASPSDIKEATTLKTRQLARVRLFLLGSTLVLVLCLLLFCMPLLFFPSWGSPTYYGTVGAIALYGLVFVLALRSRIPTLKRMEQKRQRALQGDSELLAEPQPPPNEYALDLPFTVIMRYKPRKLIPLIGIIILFPVMFLVIVLSNSTHTAFDPFVFTIPFFAISCIFCISVAALLIVQLIRGKPEGYQVTLTSDGIIDTQNRRIAWKDARLFTIASRGNRANESLYPLIFEVASADTRVRVMWLRSESARQAIIEPVVSYEEYERQMHSVLAVIAAKTGLPLYDLRKS